MIAALVLGGLACLVLAAYLVHPIAGLAGLGLALLFIGLASSPASKE